MRISEICVTCKGRGRFWLQGNDYLECPTCEGTGRFVMHEYRIQPVQRVISIPHVKANDGPLFNR